MARYCDSCNKKVGFFQKVYEEKYCQECFEKIKLEELENKKIEEQKEKMNLARDYLLYTKQYAQLFLNIEQIPFHYSNIFYSNVDEKFKIIKPLIDEMIIQLPKEYNLEDIKKLTTYRKFSSIIDKTLKQYIRKELNYKVHKCQ